MKGLGCYFVVVVKSLSHIHLFCDPMDCSQPGSLSMEFSRQEYWSGLPFTPLGFSQFWDQTHISSISSLAEGFFTIKQPGKPTGCYFSSI